jgi:hypothetical protein
MLGYAMITPAIHRLNVANVLRRRAVEDSASFIEPLLTKALLFDDDTAIRTYAFSRIKTSGLFLELGVWNGASINHFAQLLRARGSDSVIHGFDSFEGLKTDWHGQANPAGYFGRGGKLPRVETNVALHKGWIEETLPVFLGTHPGSITFAHFDLDIYESTKAALNLLRDRFAPGSIILFDEFHGYPNWRNGEFKAFHESFSNDKYRYLAFGTRQSVIELL